MAKDDLVAHSPEWWIARLWKRLDERRQRIQLYEDYYTGKHRLRYTTLKMREAFGNEFGSFADNFCVLVVDAVEERLQIRGFRLLTEDDDVAGAEAPDTASEPEDTSPEELAETPAEEDAEVAAEQITNEEAWRIWRANDLDVWSQMAHTEALVNEEAYVIVWEDPDDATTPRMTVETPFEVICAYAPGDRSTRTAALKRWIDEDDGLWYVALYLPDALHKFRSKGKASANTAPTRRGFFEQWQPDTDPEWPLPNPLGIVPVIPLVNNPRLVGGGTSEIAPVIPLQDAINKTVTDMLIASEFAAYPQRYMIGASLPKDEFDQPVEPFKAGANRLWTIEVDGTTQINPQLGQFQVTDLTPYTNAVGTLIAHVGSVSKTPKHYLIDPGGGTNLSGETIKALEAGLVSKARRKTRVFGETWAEALALAFAWKESAGETVPTTDDEDIEVQWGDVETRTEAQHVDALLKLGTLGVPTEQLWSDAGYSPQQVRRFQQLRKASPPPTQAVRITAPVAPASSVDAATGEGLALAAAAPSPMAPVAPVASAPMRMPPGPKP